MATIASFETAEYHHCRANRGRAAKATINSARNSQIRILRGRVSRPVRLSLLGIERASSQLIRTRLNVFRTTKTSAPAIRKPTRRARYFHRGIESQTGFVRNAGRYLLKDASAWNSYASGMP